ncbi:hypothetical protein U9M48_037341 [Paspalum notatum var. saurae]|uniref:Uncharacterized protein n=1 Tax=Paspalum notatum var. saurae TaxID=547442 RepID=A0AAQ3UJ41_PASNO
MDPLDATLFANRSLCWQRLKEGERALSDAQRCKELRPSWAKAWYREGMALSLLKGGHGDYEECWTFWRTIPLTSDPESSITLRGPDPRHLLLSSPRKPRT